MSNLQTSREHFTESWLFQSPSQMWHDKELIQRLGALAPETSRTRSMIDTMGKDREGFSRLAQRFEAESGNIETERRSLRGIVSSAAAQNQSAETGVTAGGTLRDSLRRAKTRQGVINRGDAAITNQRLKDRITAARSGIAQKASALDLAGAGAQIRAGIELNAQRGRDAISGARAGAAGATAGAFAARLSGNKEDTGSFFDFGEPG